MTQKKMTGKEGRKEKILTSPRGGLVPRPPTPRSPPPAGLLSRKVTGEVASEAEAQKSSNRDEVPHLSFSLDAGLSPAEGSVKPTAGFTFDKVIYPSLLPAEEIFCGDEVCYAGGFGGLAIYFLIADHRGRCQVDAIHVGYLRDHAALWFAAFAIVVVCMRADLPS